MQKLTRDALINKAIELLEQGSVTRVLGWAKGQFGYDLTPYVFKNAQQLKQDFEFSSFSAINFSKYLISETRKEEGKVLVFLKPCDTYSFNQLLTEHRLDKNKVYVVGISCEGMVDLKKLEKITGEIAFVNEEADGLKVKTIYDGEKTVDIKDVLLEKCVNCKSKKHVYYDQLMGEEGVLLDSNRFDQVEQLEKMTDKERFEFWKSQLSRCIRCNACRDVCPACTCEKCVFSNPNSGMENKAISDSFEEKMFHIIRAFHVAGRCTDCGECSRVCPQNIPLHLLNRKFIKDINNFYGEYQAGEEEGGRSPLVDYKKNDIEPNDALKKGDE